MAKKVYVNRQGVKLPYSKIEKARQYQEKINKQRELKRQKYLDKPYTFKGQENLYQQTVGNIKLMSQTRFEGLNDVYFNVETLTSEKQLDKRLKLLRRMSTKSYQKQEKAQYKRNIKEGINTVFGDYAPNRSKRIINKINQLPNDILEELYYTTEIGSIDFIYGEEPLNSRLEYFEEVINIAYEQKYAR